MAIKRDPADAAFSSLVRMRDNWTCQHCGKQYPERAQGLHCSHLFGRGARATRWMEMNAVAHCFSCHQYLGGNPDVFSKWMRGRLGDEAVDRLNYLHSLPIKLSKKDLEDIKADLKAQLKVMEVGGTFETPATILLAIDEAERLRSVIDAARMQ